MNIHEFTKEDNNRLLKAAKVMNNALPTPVEIAESLTNASKTICAVTTSTTKPFKNLKANPPK